MRSIIAIGGGEIRRDETLEIDRRIVELAGVTRPEALFIPTASDDSENYWEAFQKLYGQALGCNTSVLMLLRQRPRAEEIAEKIMQADLIYVGGGNTLRMMKLWRSLGVDKLLLQAYERGTILSGLSAGSICWFTYGHSDSRKFSGSCQDWDFIRVRGLGLLPATHSPHFKSEGRVKSFGDMIRRCGGVGIAIDDCCALLVQNNTYELIRSRREAGAYRLYRRQGKVVTEEIPPHGDLSDILAPTSSTAVRLPYSTVTELLHP